MRSVSELLKTYNVVNTPEARKFTVRFFAGLIGVALVGAGVFWMIGGSPGDGDGLHSTNDEAGDGGATGGADEEALPEFVTTPTLDGVYIGFAADSPIPETEEERLAYLDEAVQDWLAENPGATILRVERDPPAGEGPISGYYIHLVPAQPPLPDA